MSFRFVLNQRLQLVESPFVKSTSHFLACSYPFSNMGQIFHYDSPCLYLNRLLNDLFAHLVIDMLDAAGFLARDFF